MLCNITYVGFNKRCYGLIPLTCQDGRKNSIAVRHIWSKE